MEPLPIVHIYTDGSCRDRRGGWACVLMWLDQQWNMCGSELDTTNNRMELLAVINALCKLNTRCEVHLYSDSKYVLDGLGYSVRWAKKNWVTSSGTDVLNVDLWRQLIDLASNHVIVKHWVRGHTGNIYNEVCDSLAKYARDFQIK